MALVTKFRIFKNHLMYELSRRKMLTSHQTHQIFPTKFLYFHLLRESSSIWKFIPTQFNRQSKPRTFQYKNSCRGKCGKIFHFLFQYSIIHQNINMHLKKNSNFINLQKLNKFHSLFSKQLKQKNSFQRHKSHLKIASQKKEFSSLWWRRKKESLSFFSIFWRWQNLSLWKYNLRVSSSKKNCLLHIA